MGFFKRIVRAITGSRPQRKSLSDIRQEIILEPTPTLDSVDERKKAIRDLLHSDSFDLLNFFDYITAILDARLNAPHGFVAAQEVCSNIALFCREVIKERAEEAITFLRDLNNRDTTLAEYDLIREALASAASAGLSLAGGGSDPKEEGGGDPLAAKCKELENALSRTTYDEVPEGKAVKAAWKLRPTADEFDFYLRTGRLDSGGNMNVAHIRALCTLAERLAASGILEKIPYFFSREQYRDEYRKVGKRIGQLLKNLDADSAAIVKSIYAMACNPDHWPAGRRCAISCLAELGDSRAIDIASKWLARIENENRDLGYVLRIKNFVEYIRQQDL
jgi:hypothetical protein